MKQLLFAIYVLCMLNQVMAQTKPNEAQKLKTRYGFEVNRDKAVKFSVFVNFKTEGWEPELLTALKIKNDVLQFKKIDTKYLAQYQVTLSILKDNKLLFEETTTEEAVLDEFKYTNSREKYQYHVYNLAEATHSIELKPGSYRCMLDLHDLTTKNTFKDYREFSVQGEVDSLQIAHSNIVFIDPVKQIREKLAIEASGNVLKFNRAVFAYAVLNGPLKSRVNVRVFKLDKDKVLVHQDYLNAKSDTLFSEIWYEMPMTKLAEGKYELRFSAETDGFELLLEKKFEIIWFSKPTYMYKADLALRPMRYLLEPEEYDRISSLDYDDLVLWMDGFWLERDPSEGTVYNELQTEFFKRVTDANRRFSNRFIEGWESDRGKILILYGEPLKEIDKRYSPVPRYIWEYADKQRFIFIDEQRNGEFNLISEEE